MNKLVIIISLLILFNLPLIFWAPSLGKPRLFNNDSSLINLLTLGFGLPYCPFGVIVPTSIKPNPISSN